MRFLDLVKKHGLKDYCTNFDEAKKFVRERPIGSLFLLKFQAKGLDPYIIRIETDLDLGYCPKDLKAVPIIQVIKKELDIS